MSQIYDQYHIEHDIPSVYELVDYISKNNISEADMDNTLCITFGTFHRYVPGEVPSLEVGIKLRSLIR